MVKLHELEKRLKDSLSKESKDTYETLEKQYSPDHVDILVEEYAANATDPVCSDPNYILGIKEGFKAGYEVRIREEQTIFKHD